MKGFLREWSWMIAALFLGALIGNAFGMTQMKHWQDRWYAAHPIIREVAPVWTAPAKP
jgi:type II secretory pathway component PulF